MSEQQYQLVVRKGPKPGQIYPLLMTVITLGRDPMSDIVLPDPEVSRQHARLTLTDDGYQLQDLGSTNGTFVDGIRLGSEPILLQHGQEILLGSGIALVFEVVTAAEMETVLEELSENPDETDTGDLPPLPDIRQAGTPRPKPETAVFSNPASPSPQTDTPFVAPTDRDPDARRRRNTILAIVGSLFLLCCCCSFLLFMYFYGGDWLLQQLGLLP